MLSLDSIPPAARLKGRVAVVTGGGRGIGRAAALTLAGAGADVIVTARTASEIEETAEEIRGRGGSVRAVPADVSEWNGVQTLAAETERAFGPADIVLANAGVIEPVGPTWELDPGAWASNLRINLIGVFYTVRAFLPSMVERDTGVLLFTSSGAASHPVVGWSAYCAAKAGLEQIVATLGEELKENGLSIRVHAFYPGVVDTRMQAQIRQKSKHEFPDVGRFRGYHDQGVLRPPEEPAALIWWLATPMARDMHGRAVNIDDRTIRLRVSGDLGITTLSSRRS